MQELAKDEEDDPENNDEQDPVSEENEQEDESPSENGEDDLIDFRDDHQQPAGEERRLCNRDVLRRPARFGDYELDIASAFLADNQEPSNYEEAVSSIESVDWIKAMVKEIDSLLKNETWNLVEVPARAKVLPNRWVCRYKPATCGREARHKARLVVKGFSQGPGIDYEETFSPVVKFGSIRSILATAAVSRMQICQFDVKTAFLHGELTEEIFMDQPKGFEDGTGRVCNLKRALSGLKQAARCWNKKFVECLTEFNLKATSANPCVTSHNDGETLAIYIDDGLVASTSETKISDLLQHLAVAMKINAAPLGLFLGMKVKHYPDGSIFAHQASYAQKVLNRFNMNHANTVAIPADQHTDLSLLDQEDGNEIVNVP